VSSPAPDREQRDDRQLLVALGNDPSAFEGFYRRHVDRITGFAVRRCDRPDDVADLVSAVFLAVIESSSRYDPGRGDPVAWLFGIAANQLRMQRRRAWRDRAAARRVAGRRLLGPDDHVRLEERIDAERPAEAARRAIARLPRGERAAFELVARDGLTVRQVGEVLGVSETAVRVRVSRARAKLRRALDGDVAVGGGSSSRDRPRLLQAAPPERRVVPLVPEKG
jgi:RNA polymerase sigma factor (sigma-70 family)